MILPDAYETIEGFTSLKNSMETKSGSLPPMSAAESSRAQLVLLDEAIDFYTKELIVAPLTMQKHIHCRGNIWDLLHQQEKAPR